MDTSYGQVIMALMKQVGDKLDKCIREYFGDSELTVPQMAVLTLLSHNGEMRISDISVKMGLTNGTTSGIIDRLERIGLVERIRLNEDRRVVKVVLTAGSSALSHDFDARFTCCLTSLFGSIPAEEMNAIIKGLETLNKVLDEIE